MWGKRWLEKLEGHDAIAVHRALTAVAEAPAGQPITPDAARHALGASELVAAGLGKPADGFPAGAQRVANSLRPQIKTLQGHAQAALERIRKDGIDVDPHDEWDEPDGATDAASADARDWRTEMDLLSMRLSD
jgi:hypothetical protein